MAKKQTRRAVSLNRAVYDALKAACAKHRVSASSVVNTLITRWLELGTVTDGYVVVPDEIVVDVKARPVPRHEHLGKQQLAQLEWRKQEQLRRDFEQRANANPCRRERCAIVGLHPAHDEAASKTPPKTALSEARSDLK